MIFKRLLSKYRHYVHTAPSEANQPILGASGLQNEEGWKESVLSCACAQSQNMLLTGFGPGRLNSTHWPLYRTDTN
jgi:hypothetical protein